MTPAPTIVAVAGPRTAATAEGVVDERLDLPFAAAGARAPHRGDVRLGGDRRRLAQDGDLVGRLQEPHLVQGEARVAEAHRRATPPPLARAQPPEQATDGGVLLRLAPERIVHLLGAGDDLRQLVVEVVAGERDVGAEGRSPPPRRRRAARSRSPPPDRAGGRTARTAWRGPAAAAAPRPARRSRVR